MRKKIQRVKSKGAGSQVRLWGRLRGSGDVWVVSLFFLEYRLCLLQRLLSDRETPERNPYQEAQSHCQQRRYRPHHSQQCIIAEKTASFHSLDDQGWLRQWHRNRYIADD